MIFGAGTLAQRRAEVLERCQSLRSSIAAAAAPIAVKAAAADRIVGAVRRHPFVATLAAGALAGLLPRLRAPWIGRALVLYSIFRKK